MDLLLRVGDLGGVEQHTPPDLARKLLSPLTAIETIVLADVGELLLSRKIAENTQPSHH
jgi:hypothetical protein